jgi:heat shock protein HtpX
MRVLAAAVWNRLLAPVAIGSLLVVLLAPSAPPWLLAAIWLGAVAYQPVRAHVAAYLSPAETTTEAPSSAGHAPDEAAAPPRPMVPDDVAELAERVWSAVLALADRYGMAPPAVVIEVDQARPVAYAQLAAVPVPGRLIAATRTRLCVSVPLVRLLPDPALRAVLAHEIAHLRHHDLVLGLLSGAVLWSAAAVVVWLAAAVDPSAGAAAGLGAHVVAVFAHAAFSRWRESRADRAAVRACGGPDGAIASIAALTSLDAPDPRRLRRIGPRRRAVLRVGQRVLDLLHSHPTTTHRLAALEALRPGRRSRPVAATIAPAPAWVRWPTAS